MNIKQLLSLFLIGTLLACNNTVEKTENENYIFLEGFALGSKYLTSYEDTLGRNFLMELDSVLLAVDNSLSTYDSSSIISRINNNEDSVVLDELFITCFNKALEINQRTYGTFDITVGPVVNAYGFGPDAEQRPEEEYVQEKMKHVGIDKVRLEEGKIVKENPQLYLDMGGIAKGLAVDKVCEFFDRKGIANYIFELGGEVRSKGVNPKGEVFRVGIEKPIEDATGQVQALHELVFLHNKALATSGNYRRFYYVDSVKYSHTINPKNGKPLHHNLLSASVMANDCMTADAYATAFMVLGLEESLKLVERLPEIEAYFIYEEANGYYAVLYSSGMENILYSKQAKSEEK